MAKRRSQRAPHEHLKQRHELSVAHALVRYLRSIGCQASDPRAGDRAKREPDAVFDSPYGPLGIEIASGNYGEDGFVAAWSAIRDNRDMVKLTIRETVLDTHALLGSSWQQTMEDHLTRKYSVRTYLVLDGTLAGLSRMEDLPLIMKHCRLPTQGRSPAIYAALLVDTDHGVEIGIHEIVRWKSQNVVHEVR